MALNSVNNLLNFLETEEDEHTCQSSTIPGEEDRVFSLESRPPTSSFSNDRKKTRHVRIQPKNKEGRRESVSSSSSGSILDALSIPTHSKEEALPSLPRTRVNRASDEFVGVGFPSFQSPRRGPTTRNTYRSPQIMPLSRKDMKYVLVTGGVISGLGKGITASSIGLLLKLCGIRVTAIKIDPYLNIDAGTMSPYEHGEVFVLDDGGECDLDLGNYERFLDVTLTRNHNITTGKVYQNVLSRERQGEYLGKTVQVVPHVTDEIQNWISRVSRECVDGSGEVPEVCMIELGGTVGDIESSVYLEALRQFIFRVGRDNVFHIHVSLVTVVGAVGEQKSKPTQHSVRALRATGLIPNMIVCRSSDPILESIRQKVALFSMVQDSHVISVHDVNNIYQVPRMLLEQNVVQMVNAGLKMKVKQQLRLDFWDMLSSKAIESTERVTIGLVGKYTGLSDSYLSVTKALSVGALMCNRKLKIVWIESAHLEKNEQVSSEESSAAWEKLRSVDGILIPGGFGDRGIEGKIRAAQYARESKTPFLGICLGMQCAVIEYARNELGMVGANSTEFDDTTTYPVVKLMLEHNPNNTKGGTMRLGSRVADVIPNSLAHLLYGNTIVRERHRHRYEVNPDLLSRLEQGHLIFSARDTVADPVRMEMIELREEEHPFYFATQFHPEFKSRPNRVSPPFLGLVKAAARILDRQELRGKVSV